MAISVGSRLFGSSFLVAVVASFSEAKTCFQLFFMLIKGQARADTSVANTYEPARALKPFQKWVVGQVDPRFVPQFIGSAQGNTGLPTRQPKRQLEMPMVARFAKAASNPPWRGKADLGHNLGVKGPWKTPLRGKVQRRDFSPALGNPATAAGFPLFPPPRLRRMNSPIPPQQDEKRRIAELQPAGLVFCW